MKAEGAISYVQSSFLFPSCFLHLQLSFKGILFRLEMFIILSSFRARRTLFRNKAHGKLSEERQKRQWFVEETRALVAYICLYSDESVSDDWPTARNPPFWNACAAAIAETTGCPKRSGKIYLCTLAWFYVLGIVIDYFLKLTGSMNVHVILQLVRLISLLLFFICFY